MVCVVSAPSSLRMVIDITSREDSWMVYEDWEEESEKTPSALSLREIVTEDVFWEKTKTTKVE